MSVTHVSQPPQKLFEISRCKCAFNISLYDPSKSLDRRDVLRLQADAPVKNTGKTRCITGEPSYVVFWGHNTLKYNIPVIAERVV